MRSVNLNQRFLKRSRVLLERFDGFEVVSMSLVFSMDYLVDPTVLKFKRKYWFKVCQFCNGHDCSLIVRSDYQK